MATIFQLQLQNCTILKVYLVRGKKKILYRRRKEKKTFISKEERKKSFFLFSLCIPNDKQQHQQKLHDKYALYRPPKHLHASVRSFFSLVRSLSCIFVPVFLSRKHCKKYDREKKVFYRRIIYTDYYISLRIMKCNHIYGITAENMWVYNNFLFFLAIWPDLL